jgi:hypothetical protein
VDATEQRVSRAVEADRRDAQYSGKRKQVSLNPHVVTDGQYHIQAICVAGAGRRHDKMLAEDVATLQRLPDGCEALMDKGYQGLAQPVDFELNAQGVPLPPTP